MDDLANLQYLSLVSKVCKELDNHLGISDKTLAEFIIDLAKKNPELPAFRAALAENGAEFPPSFASNLLDLVCKMLPKKRPKASAGPPAAASAGPSSQYSGLSVPNDSAERREALEREALGGKATANPGIATRERLSKAPARPGGGGGGGGGASGSEFVRGPPDDRPVPGKVYAGQVANVMDFGAFVQLEGVKGRAEGLVHVSLIQNAMLRSPHDAVKRGQPCYVKVLSTTGQKISLSMKDADQRTGADLNPNLRLPGQPSAASATANPTRAEAGVDGRRKARDDDDAAARPLKRLTSPELFEAKQLIASGVLDVRDYPQVRGSDRATCRPTARERPDFWRLLSQFDETVGLMNVEATEEEVEIELNEAEPLFLRGQASAAMPPPPSPRAMWTAAPQTRPCAACRRRRRSRCRRSRS